MIPMLTAGLMVRAARTLPAKRREVVALVARPTGVVHVAVSALTPSGRWMSSAGRTVCHQRTGRLTVIGRAGGLPAITGRRLCVRCTRALARRTEVPGLDGRPMTRDQEADAFELLTPSQLAAMTTTCTTVEETHQLGRLALVLFGPVTGKRAALRTPREQQVVDLHDTVHATRRRLTTAAMTDDEREAIARNREVETADHARIQAGRRQVAARDRAIDRQARGDYLMPHERQLLNSA